MNRMNNEEQEVYSLLAEMMTKKYGPDCLKDESIQKRLQLSASEIVRNNKLYQAMASKLKPFTFEMIQRLCIMTAQQKKCRIPEASKYVRKQIRKGKTYKTISINISNLAKVQK